MYELSPTLRAEYAEALAEVGPSVTRIAAWTDRRIEDVRRDMRDQQFKTAYNNAVTMILESIDRYGSNLTVIARMFETQRHVVEAWIADNPRLSVAWNDYRQSMVDIAEYQIMLAMQDGQPWAVLKVLGTLGHDRGWGERRTINIEEESKRLGVDLQSAIRELTTLMANSPAGYIEGELADDDI